MNAHQLDEKEVFNTARKIANAAARESYLSWACGEDLATSQRLRDLLQLHEEQQSFLESPPPGVAATESRPLAEQTGSHIGPYKLLQQIGEGGMGTVFMAEQTEPVQRRVALKIIKPGMDSRQVIARFAAEKQALALMDHVNIARVLDAGTTEQGRPYFVMELVHGVPITKYCDDNHFTPRQRLELFVPVCQAIQHAHQKGIIHRDIKPSNVMVTLYDGKPVPKVIDFGVAKATEQKLTEQTLFTQYGTMVGTLEYMSPEQAEMSALGVDTRSDIYSLGVLLYELLTGSTPLSRQQMKEAAYGEILRLIRDVEPPKPSTRLSESGEALASISAQRQTEPAKLSKLMRGELDWIVMKTLEKDRNRRYETASGFAADVQRYLNDQPVEACPPSVSYRIRKFVRRNRGPVLAASLVLVALVVGMMGTTSGLLRAEQQRRNAESNSQKAFAATAAERQAKDDLREDSYFHRITLAHHALAADNLRHAIELLDQCPEELRAWEWHYLKRLCRLEPVVLQLKADANSVSFSWDGELLASAGGDGTIYVWNKKLQTVAPIPNAHTGFVSSVTFHPRRNILASVGADKKVKVWDVANSRQVFVRECDAIHDYGTAYAAAFSPDGRKLAAGLAGTVHVWEWENERALPMVLPGHAKKGINVAFSPDGRRIASGSWSGAVQIWDAETGKVVHTLTEHRHPVTALAFSPDSQSLVSANFDGRLIVWDAETGQSLRTLEAHGGLVMGVAYSPDGRRLASVALDKAVRIWDAATGREVLTLRGHKGQCGCVTFSWDPDGWRLASASKDKTIRIWDVTPPADHEWQQMQTFSLPDHEIWSLAVSPNGHKVVSAGLNSPARVWDSLTGKVTAQFPGHTHVVFSVAWHPDGRRIASAGAERGLFTLKVWDQATGEELFTIPNEALPGDPEFFAAAFSPDGKHLVTGQSDGTVKVWHAETGEFVYLLDVHDRPVRGVVFSPDGLHLASASGDGKIKLWDATRLDQKESRHTLQGHVPAQCLNVAFSLDGRVATAGEEGTVKIWDVNSGLELHTLHGHKGDIYAVAFSPDGRWVAAGGENNTVKIWDSRGGGMPIHNFRGHMGLVSGLGFTPDGDRLISGSRDHNAIVWDVSKLKADPKH